MFCSYCGKQVPDDAAFCAHCGRQLTTAEPQAAAPAAKKAGTFTAVPTAPSPQYGAPNPGTSNQPDPAELQRNKERVFTRGWKDFAGSPLVLITLLIFSVAQICSIVSSLEMASDLDSVLRYMDDSVTTLVTLIMYGSIAMSAMLVIGMWMVYVDAVSNPNSRPSSAGLRMINVITHINYIVYIVAIFIMLLLSLSGDRTIRNIFGSDVADIMTVVLLIAGAVIIAMYIAIAGILKNAIENVETCSADYSKLGGFGVFTIVMGGIAALGVLADFTVATVTSAVSTIMLGCVMIGCKTALQGIEGQYYRLRSGSAGSNQSGYNSYRGY